MPWAKIHACIPGEEMWRECFPKEFSLDEDILSHEWVQEVVMAGGRGYVEFRSDIDGDMVLETRRFPRAA